MFLDLFLLKVKRGWGYRTDKNQFNTTVSAIVRMCGVKRKCRFPLEWSYTYLIYIQYRNAVYVLEDLGKFRLFRVGYLGFSPRVLTWLSTGGIQAQERGHMSVIVMKMIF